MSTPLPPLHLAYTTLLLNLHDAGGSGDLDMYGRVTVGPTRHILPGDAHAWMVLVSRGLIAGERGRILMTDEGRDVAKAVIAGRVREAV
jgi:hypothetical protein